MVLALDVVEGICVCMIALRIGALLFCVVCVLCARVGIDWLS